MVSPDKMFGRLGNRLFQMATLYTHAKDLGVDFYFQDEKYFKKYEDEIKQLFSEGIGFLPYVGIHVRRGKNPSNPDEPSYSENPFYVNLGDTPYYDRAISLFPKGLFLVFSDDPEWCKQKWGHLTNFKIMEGQTELEDFNMLASCSSIIMANSSFSWWASYLCPNPSKVIIAPKEWYSDGIKRTITPDSWKTI